MLSESQWDVEAAAAIERWTIVEDDERVVRYETTTWLLTDAAIEDTIATSGLRVIDRVGDPAGSAYDADADLQTFVLGVNP